MYIEENGYIVKAISAGNELRQAYALRHKIFAEELHWVPVTPDGLEIDGYDTLEATGFGVFFEGSILAYIRFIPASLPFMIDKDFAVLMDPAHVIRREPDTGEISRFCVSTESRRKLPSGQYTFMFLLKGLYHWCALRNIRYIYSVVETKVFRLCYAKGIISKPVGTPLVMPDGTEAVAVIIDWRLFDEINKRQRPSMYQWFTQNQSNRFPAPSPQPVTG
ncbi:MAG: hypothetical protein M0033_09970 [Nitrospiraceae bacterium]|nr:hypothetical protein [Nitrospiraceae bacterium]